MRRSKQSYRCSFCGKDKSEALILIAGIDGHICEVCVEQAVDIIEEELYGSKKAEEQPKKDSAEFNLPESVTPRDIKDYLDQYVIGQEVAKKPYQSLSTIIIKGYASRKMTLMMRLKLKSQMFFLSEKQEQERHF